MLTPVLFEAVRSLFTADSGGLPTMVTALQTEHGQDTLALPYIILSVQDDAESDTFAEDESDAMFAFNVYVTRSGGPVGSSVRSITSRIRTVYHRVTSGAVTYNGKSYLVRFRRIGGMFVPEESSVFHWAEQYAAMIVRNV